MTKYGKAFFAVLLSVLFGFGFLTDLAFSQAADQVGLAASQIERTLAPQDDKPVIGGGG